MRSGDVPSVHRGIRGRYESLGVDEYYRTEGWAYRNPHESAIRQVIIELFRRGEMSPSSALDLACGSGEATLTLVDLGVRAIDGVDPYTGAAYYKRTSSVAIPLTFQDVALGGLAGRQYDLIVCSFALHLVARSWLPRLMLALCDATTGVKARLLITTPHKRPEIRQEWGWRLLDEILFDRVRGRLYEPLPQVGDHPPFLA